MDTDTNFGAVISGDPEASEAAQKVLNSGGNAADAAATCLLMLCVAKPGATCLGGEAPLMIYDARSQKVEVLCGLGAAPGSAKAAQWFELGTDSRKLGAAWRRRGADFFKRGVRWRGRGIHDAATPAMVHLCATLLMRHGTRSFEYAVKPVQAWLASNQPTQYRDSVHKVTINAVTGKSVEKKSPLTKRPTRLWWQDVLATFKRLIDAEKQANGDRQDKLQAVIRAFYEGEIAEELAKWYEKKHALLTYQDLARHTTKVESPVSIQYGGLEVLKCGLWTQGPMTSQALRLLDGFDMRNHNCNIHERSHLVAEAIKLAMADRFRYFGDPDFNEVSVEDLLADQYIEARRGLIDPQRAQLHGPGDPLSSGAYAPRLNDGAPASIGTTTCTIADRFGNLIAVTPSGCGSLAGAAGTTGIIHGTRLSQFTDQPGHSNFTEARKRPCITPSPTMVLKDGKPLIAASTAWGDYQDQIVVNLLVELVSQGLDFDATITSQQVLSPLFLRMPFHKYRRGELMIPLVRKETADYLTRLGHDVTMKNWQSNWSVIHVDPLSDRVRTWAGG